MSLCLTFVPMYGAAPLDLQWGPPDVRWVDVPMLDL